MRLSQPAHVRQCVSAEFTTISDIINDGARAYAGVIPADRLETPYMSLAHLRAEMDAGIRFFGCEQDGQLRAVMGIQDVKEVTLIRHAYVRMLDQGKGMGTALLTHLLQLTERPLLIGAWADAQGAIAFYRRHGFQTVSTEEKDRLLRTYWTVPERQIETSIVMADDRWRALTAPL